MEPLEPKVRVTEDSTSVILSIENSPLTTDVHRCLTGTDYLGLPNPKEDTEEEEYQAKNESNQSNDLIDLRGSPRRRAPSSDSSDSLSQRVASLLNRSRERLQEASEARDKSPMFHESLTALSSGWTQRSGDTVPDFGSGGSFLASSRFASKSASPSKATGFSYYQSAGGSIDEVLAPPIEFADPIDRPRPTASGSSAVQTLLKSLEWDHAWDTSAPGYSKRSASPLRSSANKDSSFPDSQRDLLGHYDSRVDALLSPITKRALSRENGTKNAAVAMPSVASGRVSPLKSYYSPSISPDLSSAKYFSEMKHLVEEQMQRREALIGPILHTDSTMLSGPTVQSATKPPPYTRSAETSPTRRLSGSKKPTSATKSSVAVGSGHIPRINVDRAAAYTSKGSVDSNDTHIRRLSPNIPSKSSSNTYFRSSVDDVAKRSDYSSLNKPTEYKSKKQNDDYLTEYGRSYGEKNYADLLGRLSHSHSDLTTVTPRSESALSSHPHDHHHYHYRHHCRHCHDRHAYHVDLHSNVADVFKPRRSRYSGDRSSSGEATTVESTHVGSNDAVPPKFPSTSYGSRFFGSSSGIDLDVSSSSRHFSRRLDAAVQTSAHRPSNAWLSSSDKRALPSTSSAAVQANVDNRQPFKSRAFNLPAATETAPLQRSDTYSVMVPKTTEVKTGVTGTGPGTSVAGSGSVDLSTIAGLLEEPIRAAVRKCLEAELHAVRHSAGEEPHRIRHRSSEADFSANKRRSSPPRSASPSIVETVTSAAGHLEKMLESERQIAELARLKAEEQEQRVRRLEEVLGERHRPPSVFKNDENVPPPAPAEKHVTVRHRAVEEEKRDCSPQSPPSPHRSPTPVALSPVKQRVPSPVVWFIPANKPKRQKSERPSPTSRSHSIRMDFVAPSKKDHNYVTGKLQSFLEPVSPTKSKDDMTLQDALRLSKRSFILRSTERLRRLRLHAIERKLSDERKKAVAAVDFEESEEFVEEPLKQGPTNRPVHSSRNPASRQRQPSNRSRDRTLPKRKTTEDMLFAELLNCDTVSVASTNADMKRIRAETHRRAMLLPEAVRRVEEERRQVQAKQNRLRGEIYKQKILNKLLGRQKWSLPHCLRSDLSRALLQ